jgi:hypothetical protein
MAESIPTTPVAGLTDHQLIQEYLRWRGPWGEIPSFWAGTEAQAISDRTTLLHQELRSRGLGLPSQQSIARRSGSALTVEEYSAWKSAVDEWEAGSPAPKGEDVYVQPVGE